MHIQFPDYSNCILGITSSVLKHFGLATCHPSLPLLDDKLKANFRNVVVMLFDGMGSSALEAHLTEEDFFRRQKVCDLSSVFPPTTTAATIAMQSGLLPVEHGWLGWSLYFKELDANVNIFPNTLNGTNGIPAAEYNVAHRFLPYESAGARIEAATRGEVRALNVSPFAPFRIKSSEALCAMVREVCAQEGRHYVYAYWPYPDSMMHELGVNHHEVRDTIRLLDRQVGLLCRELRDTLLIVTADHGMVDTETKFEVDHPELTACLSRPHSFESRAVNCFVKPGMNERFRDVFLNTFGNQFMLLTKADVLSKKLFGDAPPHPRFDRFLGDFLAVAVDRLSLEHMPRTPPFKAHHAGLTEDEMRVPLILAG